MELTDTGEGLPDLDPAVSRVVALFNATKEPASYEAREWSRGKFELHPVLAASDDPIVKTASFDRGRGRFTVPPRTTAVFVEP
jgi:hypothetical protein